MMFTPDMTDRPLGASAKRALISHSSKTRYRKMSACMNNNLLRRSARHDVIPEATIGGATGDD
jgi:hypothetical protein